MFEFLELLFSPSGCVGRAVWWGFALLSLVFNVFLIVTFIVLVAGVGHMAKDHAASAALGLGVIFFFVFAGVTSPVVWWIGLAIEIKRWHDRGMSGFFVLLRLVPVLQIFPLLRPHYFSPWTQLFLWAVSIVVGLFQLIQLGFLPGVESYHAPQASRRYSSGAAVRPGGYPSRGYAPQPPPPPSSGMGTFVLGFFCALFLIGSVGAAYYLGYANVPNLASLRANLAGLTNNPVSAAAPPSATALSPAPVVAPTPPPTPPASHLDDNILNREHVESDSMTKTYGKDWVIADGERMNGIIQVAAAPGLQVTIIYSNGGKNLPASSLPQAFLTQWGITPDVLAAANQPKTNQ